MAALSRNLDIGMVEKRHPVAGSRFQSRHAQRRHQGVVRHRQLTDEENRLALILTHHAVREGCGVRHIDTPLHAVMNNIAPLLV